MLYFNRANALHCRCFSRLNIIIGGAVRNTIGGGTNGRKRIVPAKRDATASVKSQCVCERAASSAQLIIILLNVFISA